MRYVGHAGFPDADALRQRIQTWQLAYYARGGDDGFWAVIEKASGAFLGWFHLRPALDYRFATEAGYEPGDFDLGYRFRRAAWGKGYATEGAQALVQRAFARPEVRRVVATALVSNAASIRVMEKTGLRRMHEFTLLGFEQPAVKYGLSKDDYLTEGPPTR
jgi:RimJ/RimL family protein N-acetyltransferase